MHEYTQMLTMVTFPRNSLIDIGLLLNHCPPAIKSGATLKLPCAFVAVIGAGFAVAGLTFCAATTAIKVLEINNPKANSLNVFVLNDFMMILLIEGTQHERFKFSLEHRL